MWVNAAYRCCSCGSGAFCMVASRQVVFEIDLDPC